MSPGSAPREYRVRREIVQHFEGARALTVERWAVYGEPFDLWKLVRLGRGGPWRRMGDWASEQAALDQVEQWRARQLVLLGGA